MISRVNKHNLIKVYMLQCTDTRFLLVGENPRNSSIKKLGKRLAYPDSFEKSI